MSFLRDTRGTILEIPEQSGDNMQLALHAGERLYVVGANGSGKSALIQHLVSRHEGKNFRRVSAHRQTWLPSGSIDLTPRRRQSLEEEISQFEMRNQARWSDTQAHQKQLASLFDLVAIENEQARRVRRLLQDGHSEEAMIAATEEQSPFDMVNALFGLAKLGMEIRVVNGEEIQAENLNGGMPYSMAQMSDGERSAALIAATVLTADERTVFYIDEPERHLHRSIIEPFLSALFQCRSDCMFVISTHEIALPVSDPESRSLLVRSCSWEGDRASFWDVELLEPNDALPEDLKRAILGSRKRILFVEGNESSSLDSPLYNALFPDISVVPREGCANVIRAVKGLRGSENLHDVEAYGLIDRDGRPNEEVEQLANENIFALEVITVESLYYCSDAINAVAQRQAETFQLDATHMIEKTHRSTMTALTDSELARRMAAMRCERQVRNRVMSKLPTLEAILANGEESICVEFSSPLENENEILQTLIANQDLNGLIARYPLRKSNVFNDIARSLRFPHRKDYEQALLARIRTDENLAQKLKRRIEPLAKALA